jgi:hypothetical protein
VLDKGAPADDEVIGAVQLEEKGLGGGEHAKARAPARLQPDENNFWQPGQVSEPVVVGDADVELHGVFLSS